MQQDFVVGVDLVDVDGVGKKAGEEDRPKTSPSRASDNFNSATHPLLLTDLRR